MFCSKCGKEVASGAKFCPACGNKLESKSDPVQPSLAQRSSTPKEKAVEEKGAQKVLYTSKGYPERYYKRSRVTSLLSIVAGVALMILSQAHYHSSAMSIYSGGQLVHSGTLGGGSMFNAEGQQGLFILGLVFILLGIGLFFYIRKLHEMCALTLFENKITGIKMGQKFELNYGQVTEVLSDTAPMYEAVTIVTNSNKYRVIVSHDAEQAATIIREKARGEK